MAITGIDSSSYYSDYYTNATNAQTEALQNTLGQVNESTATEEELMDACKEFEAYFLEQIYKGMEKTIMKADDDDSSSSSYMDYFGDMQIQEYAEAATNQGDGIGLAKQLFEQMKRNYGLE
jgi:flagellar protein FlgJ